MSQKNLSLWQRISDDEKLRRQPVTDVFCSTSTDRSRNDSSRFVICPPTRPTVTRPYQPC